MFSCEFREIFKNIVFTEHLRKTTFSQSSRNHASIYLVDFMLRFHWWISCFDFIGDCLGEMFYHSYPKAMKSNEN